VQALKNLAGTGQLTPEPTSVEEITGFLMRAEQQLTDARTASLSAASRFSLAYDAAHAFALVALRAQGYRPGKGLGHRMVAFSTLVHTVGLMREAVERAERKQRHHQAIARILERRKNAPTVTEEDIRAAREEGRP